VYLGKASYESLPIPFYQAVEKQVKQREAIQNWLAEIPEKLETIQRWSEIHHGAVRLHPYADAIMVAIFTVLERIVDKITRTWRSKSPISLSGGK
jgi:hypothetical protein